MNRRLVCIGIVAALIGGAATAQPTAAPLRLCVDPANLPFSSSDPAAEKNGAPGLYVEIGRAVAAALGRPVENVWSLTYFGRRNLRATLLAGQCDLAVGLPAERDFMGPALIFSRPILRLGYALVSPAARASTSVDDLAGKRVAVQFGSPPQSLLALRDDVTLVTTMDPDDAMRRLSTGQVDAAFVWGPTASYINHVSLKDAYTVVPVDLPQMSWSAAIAFGAKQTALRDQVDAVLPALAPKIRELASRYEVVTSPDAMSTATSSTAIAWGDEAAEPVVRRRHLAWSMYAAGPSTTASDAAPSQVAVNDPAAGRAGATAGDPMAGKTTFNGTCSHCHGPDANIADRKLNLRGLKRRYGDEAGTVFQKTVNEGRPSKGMPAWKDVFTAQDFTNILSYLSTIQEP